TFVNEWPQLIKCMGLVAMFNVSYYIILGYTPGYMTSVLGYSTSTSSIVELCATGFLVALIPVSGLMADRIGRRIMLICGSILLIIFAVPAFTLLNLGSLPLLRVGRFVLLMAQLAYEAPLGATLVPPLRAHVRFSALALCANVSVPSL